MQRPNVLSSFLARVLPRFVNFISFKLTEPNFFNIYTSLECLFPLVVFLKNSAFVKMDQLVDICGLDQVGHSKRFMLLYIFSSTSLEHRAFVYVYLSEGDPIPSISGLFKNAMWLEREVWDLLGIFFHGHSDLRRILTDYGFEGFPLRKDFPLSGYVELRYDDVRMHIVYEPVELSQTYRYFNSLSPWESLKI